MAPRKKTTTTTKDTATKQTLLDCRSLTEDTMSQTVAGLVADNTITREQGERIIATLSPAISDCFFRIISTKGL